MTQSIATLGIRVRSDGVKDAERDLRALAEQGAATERRATALGKAWGVALGATVAAGAGVALAGLKKWTQGGIEAEKVQAQLAARIKSTGAAAGLAIGDLNRMAAALQAATTFDDESIGRAQAVLLTFTKLGGGELQRATEAVLDMSAALGTDLQSAALQVGKALNAPAEGMGALSRAGVQFTDAQKEAIKALEETGRVAEAQRIILRELETQMGGSARAARDTLGGGLEALGNSFDNLLEGDAGGMRGARDAVEQFNRALNDPQLKAGLDAAFTGMLNLANGAVQLISKLGNAASALREFYGDASTQSRNVLENRRTDLESELFRVQRRSGNGLSDANDPIGKLFGLASGRNEKVAQIKAQIAEIDRALAGLARKRDDWVEGRVVSKPGTGRWANVTSDPMAAPVGTLDVATGEVRAKGMRSVATAAREAADALRDYSFEEAALERASLAQADAQSQALEQFARMRAELEGPLAVAQFDHIKALQDIARLGHEAGLSAEAVAAAQDLQRGAYERATEAIREQQLVMANPEAVATLDTIRRTATDALTDITLDFRNAENYAKSFFDTIARQITSGLWQQFINGLLGQPGTSGAGTSGGAGLFSILSTLFGGGRAIGGPVSAGMVYEVNERGPEIYSTGGRNYLLPVQGGHVTPMATSQGNGGVTVHQSIVIQGRMDNSTPDQIARRGAAEFRRAASRA